MSTSYIEVTGADAVLVSSAESAQETRDELLIAIRELTFIENAEDAQGFAEVLTRTKQFTRFVEASRKSAKEPVLEFGKRIDGVAKDLTRDLEAEADRISRLLGSFQADENKKAEAARRLAWEEEQRIRDEANRLQREAEAKEAAIQAELERKASVARSEGKKAEYEALAAAKAERARVEQEERDKKTEESIILTRVQAATVAAPKADGVSTRTKICFEVTDIVALFEAAPYLVNLSPNTAAINNAIKSLGAGQSLPGIRVWRENVSVVR